MQIKIQSTDGVIWQWESDKITIPTSKWEITILPNHAQMISDIAKWVIKIYTQAPLQELEDKYIYTDWAIVLSINEWLLYIWDNNINIMSWYVSVNPTESAEHLSDLKTQLQTELANIDRQIDPDEYMNILNQIEKINSDIRLHKFTI